MKKVSRLLPLFAITAGVALAAVTSAFRTPHHRNADDPFIFEYQPPSSNDYSVASVENDSNWVYTETAPECGGVDKACSLKVPVSYVNPGSTPTLKSSINIQAELGSGGNAKVVSTDAGGDATIDNQPD